MQLFYFQATNVSLLEVEINNSLAFANQIDFDGDDTKENKPGEGAERTPSCDEEVSVYWTNQSSEKKIIAIRFINNFDFLNFHYKSLDLDRIFVPPKVLLYFS